MKHKNQKFTMNKTQAEHTLQNVFSACDIKMKLQENAIAKLQEKHRKESRNYHLMMVISIVFLFLVLLTPLCFISTPAKVTPNSTVATPLEVYEYHAEGNAFYITLCGGDVDYQNITIINSLGETVPISSYDEVTCTISFPYDGTELNLYIPDTGGNELHLLLSPQK